jgi:hypothetical protein
MRDRESAVSAPSLSTVGECETEAKRAKTYLVDGVDDAVLASMGVVLERMRTVTDRLRDEIPGIVPR